MGTNYYAIPKATYELKTKIKLAIDNENFTEAKQMIPHEVHLGKLSGGWRFAFDHNNGEHYAQTRASIDVFLDRCTMVDEYQRPISKEEFWEMVDESKNKKADIQYGFIADGLNFINSTDFS